MHTLLGLSSMLLVVLGGALALGILRRLGGWAGRRDLQFFVLAAPVVSLALGLGGLHHFAGRTCFMGAPTWEYAVSIALPLGMGLVALGGLGLGVIRLTLLARLVARRGVAAEPELQELANALADRIGTTRPRILLCAYGRPLAFTCGLWRPRILLSTWMVACLDQRELEAVLAHELGHVARHDYLIVWLATVLRDAFCYLPTSWAAYRQLQDEKELACDEVAVRATQRPLALASALAKVWQDAVEGSRVGPAQALLGAGEAIERRITRLLDPPTPVRSTPPSRPVALGVGAAALVGLLALQAVNAAVMLAPMGCGPAAPLWRIFA